MAEFKKSAVRIRLESIPALSDVSVYADKNVRPWASVILRQDGHTIHVPKSEFAEFVELLTNIDLDDLREA